MKPQLPPRPGSPPPRYGAVGERWYDAYWGEDYDVLAHNDDGSVTVRWVHSGVITTHRTLLSRRDRYVGLSPEAKKLRVLVIEEPP